MQLVIKHLSKEIIEKNEYMKKKSDHKIVKKKHK